MAVIGSSSLSKSEKSYFYRLTRNSDNDLIFTKVDLASSNGDSVDINNKQLESAGNQHIFLGFLNLTSHSNVDENREIIDEGLGHTQYQIVSTNLSYSVDENGYLIASVIV